MRAQISANMLFIPVLVLVTIYAFVWFSHTQWADLLRNVGIPVPYCTRFSLVSMCEMDYVRIGPGYIYDANKLDVLLVSRPSSDMLNAMCSLSDKGVNVRVVMSNFLQDDNSFRHVLDQCKIKYRFSPQVRSNELSTGKCYLNFTSAYGVYTCCKPVVSAFERYFSRLWGEGRE